VEKIQGGIHAESAARLLEPMRPLFQIVEETCASGESAPLTVLLGILDVAREHCLGAIRHRAGHSEEVSQATSAAGGGSQIVADRWLSPKAGAAVLGVSVRTLSRRARRPPYASFCIRQPERGYKVSAAGLNEHMKRERNRARR
jgi:hypothetical protein